MNPPAVVLVVGAITAVLFWPVGLICGAVLVFTAPARYATAGAVVIVASMAFGFLAAPLILQ